MKLHMPCYCSCLSGKNKLIYSDYMLTQEEEDDKKNYDR